MNGHLKVIMIDVGWGDSIFIESKDEAGNEHFALIDSNDSSNTKSSLIFLTRYFQRKFKSSQFDKPLFDWIMLSHAHLDHGQGLKEIMKVFGAKEFFYPKSMSSTSLAHLQKYANNKKVMIKHQSVDSNHIFPNLGDAKLKILWPIEGRELSENENDNSIILLVEQFDKTCVFTGDAEEDVWNVVADKIPANTVFMKVPHHGSRNGSLDGHGDGTWTNHLNGRVILGMSTHNKPYNHPHQEVLDLFDYERFDYLRTDENYHLEVMINSEGVNTKYSKF